MKPSHISIALLVVSLLLVPALFAQSLASGNQSAAAPAPTAATGEVPRMIKFSGTLLDEQGQALKGPLGVTFALYSQQTGGAALWMETQNVQPDAKGNYAVLLGANSAQGVPAELFVSGEARWLGIQAGQQPEHERILLVSVPYALKAGDAETLGGKPLSSFVLNEASATGSSARSVPVATPSAAGTTQTAAGTSAKTSATPQAATPCSSVTSDGAAAVNSIGLFTTPCNIESSLMRQVPINGFPGVNVAGNNAGLLLNGTGTHQVTVTGATSGRLGQDGNGFFFASDTNGKSVRFLTNNGALNEWMRVTSAGNIGIGTATPAQKLSVAGMIQSTAGGIMFPDTTVQSSAGITQAAADARYAQLGAASNAFTGSITASSFTGSGAALTSLNASNLTSGLVPSPQLGGTYSNPMTFSNASNSFTGSGAGLTNVNAATLSGLAQGAFAQLGAGSNVFAGSVGANGLQTTQINSGAGSNGNGLGLLVKANDAVAGTNNGAGGNININAGSGPQSSFGPGGSVTIDAGNGGVTQGDAGSVSIKAGTSGGTGGFNGNVNIVAGSGFGPGGTVNVTAGNSAAGGGGAVNIIAGNGGPAVSGGDIVLTPGASGFKAGTVRTTSEIRMGSENGTAEGPFVTGGYQGLVIRRINSSSTAGMVARTDTMALFRDGTASGFQISVGAAGGNFSIACLGLTSTTTVVGFTDSFVNPSGSLTQVFNQTDLLQFNCSFGNTGGSIQGGHVTEVNLLRSPGGSTWVGTVTSTYNQ